MMYPQEIELKTLGRDRINPDEVKKHYVSRGQCKVSDFGSLVTDLSFHTMINEKEWVAHNIEKRPKYVSCASCGKSLSFTEVDYKTIQRIGESGRILYVDDAEKQREDDNAHNEEMLKDAFVPTTQLHHIRNDTEIMVDSYVYKGKYISSILDGLEENSKNHRNGKEVDGIIKTCYSCQHDNNWWSTPTF